MKLQRRELLIDLRQAVDLRHLLEEPISETEIKLELTMSDANGRPLMIQDPTESSKYAINGSPGRDRYAAP